MSYVWNLVTCPSQTNGWFAITYGKGLFVAVCRGTNSNTVMTSPDGINWTLRTAINDFWKSVTYGVVNGIGLFVAVSEYTGNAGTGNRIMTSLDGITWTLQTTPTTPISADIFWTCVTYGTVNGNGLFVAVGYANSGGNAFNRAMISSDGVSWTMQTTPTPYSTWTWVTYGNGLFVAVASATTTGVTTKKAMTSPDGVNWTLQTTNINTAWQGVAYGNGVFVAVSNSVSANNVMTSPDGVTWTAQTPPSSSTWIGITFGNKLFAAVTNVGVNPFNCAMTSPDGIDWTLSTTPVDSNTWIRVGFGNGLFVALSNSANSNKVMTLSNPIVCFKEDTKILTNKGYICIQDLRKGDLVKTIDNGYIPIDMIGKRVIYHPAINDRNKDQLYQCSQPEYPEVWEPLIITGSHCILVDDFISEEQKEKVIEVYGNIYITDNKYRLPACVDSRASVYESPGDYTIYHFALENDDYYMNYGIYANGLLVETCSKRYLKELSYMSIIE